MDSGSNACNIKVLLFIRLPCVRQNHSDATNVLYAARLVRRAFCMQPIVR